MRTSYLALNVPKSEDGPRQHANRRELTAEFADEICVDRQLEVAHSQHTAAVNTSEVSVAERALSPSLSLSLLLTLSQALATCLPGRSGRKRACGRSREPRAHAASSLGARGLELMR